MSPQDRAGLRLVAVTLTASACLTLALLGVSHLLAVADVPALWDSPLFALAGTFLMCVGFAPIAWSLGPLLRPKD